MTLLTKKQSSGLLADSDVSIIAGAGSGKTTVLIEKLFRIIASWHRPGDVPDDRGAADISGLLKSVLCITFTNKAAGELRERLCARLEAEEMSASGESFAAFLLSVRENIHEMTVATMDSFFSSLLRENAMEISISPTYSVCDPGSAGLIFARAVRNVMTVLSSDATVSSDRRLVSFRPVFNELYSFFKTASGLTDALGSILSKRLFFNGVPSAPTSDSIKERIAALDALCSDYLARSVLKDPSFERLAGILASYGGLLGAKSAEKARNYCELYESAATGSNARDFFRFLVNDYQRVSYDGIVKNDETLAGQIDELKEFISSVKEIFKKYFRVPEVSQSLSPFESRFFGGLLDLFDMCENEYGRLKSSDDMLDFSDIERLCAESPGMLASAGGAYSHILIDEFQDTNRLQKYIIDMLVSGRDEGARPLLTVVGDGMQSIYRFRNAQSALFSEISGQIASRGGAVVEMSENFRSSPAIIEFINGFFENYLFDVPSAPPLCNEKPLPLEAAGSGFAARDVSVEAAVFLKEAHPRVPELQPETSGASDVAEPDEPVADQYEFIASRVKKLVRDEGYSFGDVMVLMSRMTHVRELEKVLTENGIPSYIFKSRDFYGRPEIFDVLNLVRFLVTPDDDFGLVGLLRSPLFAVDDPAILGLKTFGAAFAEKSGLAKPSLFASLKNFSCGDFSVPSLSGDPVGRERVRDVFRRLESYLSLSRTLKPFELLSKIFDDICVSFRYGGGFAGSVAVSNLRKLAGFLASESYIDSGSPEELLESLETLVESGFQEEEAQDASGASERVQIMTVHQSKGLQSKVVVIPELEARFFRKPALAVTDLGDIAFASPGLPADGGTSLMDAYYDRVVDYEKLQSLFEKKRLFYVAMTRAKELIVMTGSAKVAGGGMKKSPCAAAASSWLEWLCGYLGLTADFLRGIAGMPEGRTVFAGASACRVYSSVPVSWKSVECASSEPPAAPPAARSLPELRKKPRVAPVELNVSYSSLRSFVSGEISTEKPPEAADALVPALDAASSRARPGPPGPDLLGVCFHSAAGLLLAGHGRGRSPASLEIIAMSAAERCVADVSGRKAVFEKTLSMLEVFSAGLSSDKLLDSYVTAGEGEKAYFELPFEWRLEEASGRMTLSGFCDLVIVDPAGAARIVDFKSGDHSGDAALMDEYRRQLAFYSMCVENSLFGVKRISGAAVVFLCSGAPPKKFIVEFPPPGKEVRDEIRRKCVEYKAFFDNKPQI